MFCQYSAMMNDQSGNGNAVTAGLALAYLF